MKKRTRSILEELNNLGRSRNSDHLIDSTANNIIESAINLLNRISNTYDENTAGELERRFLNAIKSGDPKKFRRGMQKIIESKQNDSIE
jgi:DNA-binding FadR family transcriptional regulator